MILQRWATCPNYSPENNLATNSNLYILYNIVKLTFQMNRKGDSGGPIIWEDKDDDYRAYVVGIMSQIISNPTYGMAVTVPGTIFNWVKAQGGKEVDDCLVKN